MTSFDLDLVAFIFNRSTDDEYNNNKIIYNDIKKEKSRMFKNHPILSPFYILHGCRL